MSNLRAHILPGENTANKCHRLMGALLALLLAFALPLGALAAEEAKQAELRVDAQLLSAPSEGGEVVAKMQRGAKLSVSTFHNGYYAARYEGQQGYVLESAVRLLHESVVIKAKGTISADQVNLRTKASITSEIITQLSKGTSVEIVEACANWFKVVAGKEQGYVHMDYVDVTEVDKSDVYVELKMGMSGNAVIRLQDALKAQGYYSGKCNGNYGAKTREAVKKFQKDKGLVPDGIATAKTQEALFQSGR